MLSALDLSAGGVGPHGIAEQVLGAAPGPDWADAPDCTFWAERLPELLQPLDTGDGHDDVLRQGRTGDEKGGGGNVGKHGRCSPS
jgi:hypothetical protein